MSKLKTLLVDDEKYSRENLTSELKNHEEIIQIIGEANSVESAVPLINELKPELVFLDINLGDGTGFDILEQVEYKDFKLVFLTAYDQYAIKAMKFSALDYLLKPLNKSELAQLIHRLVVHEFKQLRQIESLLENITQKQAKKIAIPTNEGLNIHDVQEIVRCQSDGNYTTIFFRDKSKILSSKTLKHFDELLENNGFERIHNSHLVNMQHVKKYINSDGGFLKMSDDSEIPISQRKKTQVLAALEDLL